MKDLALKKRILLVDDDLQSLDSTRKILEHAGHEVLTARDGEDALEKIRQEPLIRLVVSDVRMPRMTGLEFLKALSIQGFRLPVILMTAYGEVSDAVWAMKGGAIDFLSKPFKRQALLDAVRVAFERGETPEMSPQPETLESQAMRQLREQLVKVAQTRATVLIQGESGTGKELIARELHQRSSRSAGPWIALNCGAVPESLLESELFGHERGAFTGAHAQRIGLFEAADQGTLFLDEIAELPLSAQVKLLRVLQEGEIRRVGSAQSRRVDVRLVAATHRDLRAEVAAGRFREDLLYRLEVIRLRVPPLRERLEDLPQLVSTFVREACEAHGKTLTEIDGRVLLALGRHSWPGNVRELRNLIERAVVFADGGKILPEHLPEGFLPAEGTSALSPSLQSTITVRLGTPLKEVEDLLIRRTLEATEGDKVMTAKLLGINSRTIYRRLESER